MPEVIDLLYTLQGYTYNRNYGPDYKVKDLAIFSEELPRRGTIAQAIEALKKRVDVIEISTNTGDARNAFAILERKAGKRKADLIARSTIGAGYADVFQYFYMRYKNHFITF